MPPTLPSPTSLRVSLRTSLREVLGGLPRAYWALWVGLLVNRIGSFVVPFLSLYLTNERGLSVGEAGGLVSLWGLGAIGAGPVAGVVADRLGRRAALLGSLVGGAAFTVALGFVRAPAVVAPLVFAVGFVGEIYRPASHAVVGDVVPPEDRVRAFGLLYWAVNLGVAIGLALAGLIASVSYTLLFVGDGLTSLAFAWVVWRFVPETRPESRPETVREVLAGLVVPLRDRVFLPFLLLHLTLATIFFQFQLTLPLDMAANGISPAGFGLLMAMNGGIIVVLQPLAARWIASRDPAHAMAVGAALIGLGFGYERAPPHGGLVCARDRGLDGGRDRLPPGRVHHPVRAGAGRAAGAIPGSVLALVGGGGLRGAGARRVGARAVRRARRLGRVLRRGVLVAGGQLVAGPARRRRIEEIRAARE